MRPRLVLYKWNLEHGGILKEASGDQVVVQTSLASTVHPGRAGTSHVARGSIGPKSLTVVSSLFWGFDVILEASVV